MGCLLLGQFTIVILDKAVWEVRVDDEMRRGQEPPIEAIQERSPS